MKLYGLMSDIKALAGMLFGMNPKSIVTYIANEVVDYGKGLFMKDGKVANTKNANKAVVDITAYTTSGKNIAITINGVAVTTLVTTGTIANDVATLVDSINDEVEGVNATAGADNKITLVSEDDTNLTVKLVYDGSDVTSSKVTMDNSEFVFAGVAVFHQSSFKNSKGSYEKKEAVACLNDGNIWVVLADGEEPKDGDPAYCGEDGKFTTTGSTVVGIFKSGSEDGLAIVDMRK